MEISKEQYETLNILKSTSKMLDTLTEVTIIINTRLNTLEERVRKLEVSHFGQSYESE